MSDVKSPRVWSKAELDYMHHLYFDLGLGASKVHEKVVEKFGGSQTLKQVYGCLEQRKWPQKRRALADEALAKGILAATAKDGAIEVQKEHQKAMEEFVRDAASGAKRAFAMVKHAKSAREMSAAAASAASLVRTYRLCAGLDGNSPSGPTNFVFNFTASTVTDAVDAAKPAEKVGSEPIDVSADALAPVPTA